MGIQNSRQDILLRSEAHFPTADNSVFDSTENIVNAMIESASPKMLIYCGSYWKGHEVNLGDAFSFQFPLGSDKTNIGKTRR